jgi:hypothetical protein
MTTDTDHRTPPISRRRGYPAEKARQGEIILKSPWQRGIFIAGLVGLVVLAFVLPMLMI